MNRSKDFDVIRDFDEAPDSMLVDIRTGCIITHLSRSSIYRRANAGELELVKVGGSARLRVGGLRRLIGA